MLASKLSSSVGNNSGVATYIEDVFSTYLYTGTGATQTITNGIDLSTKGGMIWTKDRNTARNNVIYDTTRGFSKRLVTNTTDAQTTATVFSTLTTTSYNADWPGTSANETNANGETYASWTFRKQPKFFDVVTYTGNNIDARQISHSLGSAPGCIIVKNLSSAQDWMVWHRSLGTTGGAYYNLRLNTTAATVADNMLRGASSTTFTVSNDVQVNGTSSNTYVAYLFAHDAGGFGLTGTDNVISCGSFTKSSGVVASISLGYEPQWLLFKRTDTSENWFMIDNMRNMTMGTDEYLIPNLTNAAGNLDFVTPTATGFEATNNFNNGTYIYIAIRRGPMKVPTSGTSVFTPVASRSSGTSQSSPIFNAGFPVDTLITGLKAGGGDYWIPRLTVAQMTSSSTAVESSASSTYNFGGMLGILSATGDLSNSTVCGWNFKRAPSFHDVVCYTGTGSATTQTHNLGVAPEMMIVKIRNGADSWIVYHSALGATKYILLDGSGVAQTDSTMWNNTAPTASVFSLGSSPGTATNLSGSTYVAYLFATATGVSKVGSYTGTGTTQQINCGFTSGARFVLIKRTSTGGGDWYVWDTARGIVSGNDPYLLLNSTAAEVTTTDYIDTYSAGFEISSTAPAAINASGGTFIFLAIA